MKRRESKKPVTKTVLAIEQLARVSGGQGIVQQGPGTPVGIGTSPSGDGVGTTPT